jgi:DHA2 family multidrug resistance protein
LPAFAQYLMAYPATEAGLILMPGGLLLMLLFPLVGRLLNKVDLRVLIAIGILITGCALWWMTNLYLDISFNTLALARTLQYVGMAFLFLPINALGFRDIPAGQTNYASALVNLARNFGGSIGVAFASTLIVRRSQFHQSRMVEHLQSMNGAYPDFIDRLGGAAHEVAGGMTTLAQAFQEALRQASLLSYLDAFKALSLILLLLLPFLLLVKRGTASGRAAEAA